MDFSQFLVNNPEIPNVKAIKTKESEKEQDNNERKNKPKPIKKEPKPKDKVIDLKSVFKNTEQIENKLTKETTKENVPEYQDVEFKRGDFVKIIRLEGSPLNVYKGYNGEIKEYIYRSDSAYIVLEAMTYPRRIKFPLGHFKHRYS
jgi:transcription antitermination factor NusG